MLFIYISSDFIRKKDVDIVFINLVNSRKRGYCRDEIVMSILSSLTYAQHYDNDYQEDR